MFMKGGSIQARLGAGSSPVVAGCRTLVRPLGPREFAEWSVSWVLPQAQAPWVLSQAERRSFSQGSGGEAISEILI